MHHLRMRRCHACVKCAVYPQLRHAHGTQRRQHVAAGVAFAELPALHCDLRACSTKR